MAVIPNFGWYWASKLNDDENVSPSHGWHHYNNNDCDVTTAICVIVAFGFTVAVIIEFAIPLYKAERKMDAEYAPIREVAANEILESAYSRAVQSLDTVNFANYSIVSPKIAERDSVRYSRKISNFINNSGTDYLYNKFVGGAVRWKLTFDKNAATSKPKIQKLLKKYEQACQQLVARRKFYTHQSR